MFATLTLKVTRVLSGANGLEPGDTNTVGGPAAWAWRMAAGVATRLPTMRIRVKVGILVFRNFAIRLLLIRRPQENEAL